MRVSRMAITAALLSFSLAACSDFTSSGDPLDQAEAGELAEAIVGQGFPGTGGVTGAAPMPAPTGITAAPAAKITVDLNESGPCEGGGTATIAGKLTADVNQQSQTGTLEYSFTLAPSGCVVVTADAKRFTINGDPSLKAAGKLDWSTTQFSGTLDYSGKFRWEATDGRTGACGVDLKATFDLAMGTTGVTSTTAALSGVVCGVSVTRNVTVEA